MKDYVRAAIIIVAFLGLTFGFIGCGASHAAPAPVKKTERKGKMPAPPLSCIMKFTGVHYTTQFHPGGNYRAAGIDVDSIWVGSWNVAKGKDGGFIMVIHEHPEGTVGGWLTFSIPLTPCLRHGRADWEDRFHLEG